MTPRARAVLYFTADLTVVVGAYFVARQGVAFSVAFLALVVYFLGSAYLRSPRIVVQQPGTPAPLSAPFGGHVPVPRSRLGGPWQQDRGTVTLDAVLALFALLVIVGGLLAVAAGLDGPAL